MPDLGVVIDGDSFEFDVNEEDELIELECRRRR